MLDRLLGSPLKLFKRVRQGLYFISHRADHAEYMRVIRRARAAGVAPADKLIDLKYLGVYLSEFMSTETRRRILMDHYAFLSNTVAGAGRGTSWAAGVTIWQRRDDAIGQDFRIVLEQSALSPMEGESQLRFEMGERTLCTLTFSFLHGASIDLPHAQIMFIGGVQGGLNCQQEIRIAAKSNGEIVPNALLLIAAKGIAEALDVGHIVGVASDGQAAMGYAREKIRFSYDAMWLDAGAIHTAGGFFIVTPGVEKPIDDIASKHRSRSRRKRQLKVAIKDRIRRETAELFGLVVKEVLAEVVA